MKLIEYAKWRYATKKMDRAKKVSEENIELIREAIQLSASSYGLQPYKVLEIVSEDLREKLQPLCWNQGQITDASHLFVLCNKVTVTDADVNHVITLKAQANNSEEATYAGYGDFVKKKLKEKSESEMFHWTAKQTYIALGNGLSACAELGIDSTPMEGFDVAGVDELLGLEKEGFSACVLLGIGYRSEDDDAQHAKKIRKTVAELFEKR